MEILSIILFFSAIILAFLRKNNIGIIAVLVGVIAIRIFGLTDTDLISGVSVSLFTTLAGVTLLFSVVTNTGALDLLARKLVSLAGSRIWLLPILIALTGWVLVAVGPGGVPVLAIIPPLAVSIAKQAGYNPLMMAMIGISGMLSARFSPLTPEGNIISSAVSESGFSGFANPAIMLNTGLTSIIVCIFTFILFKGYKVKAPKDMAVVKVKEKFNGKQIAALLGIAAMLVLIIFCGVNIGMAAFSVAAVLLLLGVADDAECIKAMPWNTILMVLCVGALLGIVDSVGGIDMMTNALAEVMNSATATPLIGLSASLLSLVSSALSVVYPTMMPMCADLAAQVGSVNPVALMSAVAAGGALAGVSPMSTGGALIMGALGNGLKAEYTKEYQNKVFIQLILFCIANVVILLITSVLFYNPLANLLCPV
ncbi:Dicarboxylate carrier protein MatC N-terminus [uncultured Roseburia sp.]|uniref:SLC13 family permease n=1 Tax=Brotonthovivens ammoniilytica TaxID=2981725 RepID=A0ABT2TLK1_9FIRM|nr:SLC13 family permease [Brotonthovivens ammoniilytica]MCU6762701.1 SLC13 family permease [Brotonthovivens ammoniilytica]SCI85324.1 Dicarboxylate carrier protein MatC N-terminus [uncultured Roseburia sp.]